MKNVVLLLLLLFLVCWGAAQEPGRYDVVIHEIFADPTPSRGMPASEFIEVRNRSSTAWNLRNWTISNGSTTGRINTSFILKPDSLAILCGSAAAAAFQPFGPTVVVSSFPALDNDGDTLVISSPSGMVIHALAWNKDWYGNEVKQEGGWSLEMMDSNKPCLMNSNWTASNDIRGASPGKKNSVERAVADTLPPSLLYGFLDDSITAVLLFSEPLLDGSNWQLNTDPPAATTNLVLKPPLFHALEINLSTPLRAEEQIKFTLNNVKDCSGNTALQQSTITGLFSPPGKDDVVINEILFNPPTGGTDYVELYNAGRKNINLKDLQIANRNGSNRISSITVLSGFPYPVLPGEYVLISTNNEWVFQKYQPPPVVKTIQLASMPTYPDDKGEVILLNNSGEIIDELNYDEKWHFTLISEKEGISLERISAGQTTNDPFNWHSASTSSGYGTPGYRNSQVLPEEKKSGSVSLSTGIISPDMDGRDDFLLINYHFPSPGNLASVTAFDSKGRAVRSIIAGSLCGTSGSYRWDGLDHSGALVPRGVYIILTEVFDLQGKTKKYRHTVAVYH
ncbi:MAG TPA: lamin tail domain-containing protein [Chitinophagaceae bacterium]|nr:lamin tail domain-containing protein [Chitinophagaceae bacterium]